MATSNSSSRSPPSREQPPLYQKLSWPARFAEKHCSEKRLALNFSDAGEYPVLFAKHPFRLQRSDESSGHSQTAAVSKSGKGDWRKTQEYVPTRRTGQALKSIKRLQFGRCTVAAF